MIECEICYEQIPDDQLGIHGETCLVRLAFRCSICNEDYVNREGLWSHLDLHEIVGDKELHCQEMKVKHKLHQCVRCNDQRGYSESSYQAHVLNIHGNCGAQVQLSASDFHVLELPDVQSIEANEQLAKRLMVKLRSDTNNEAESELFLTQGENVELEIKVEEPMLQEQQDEPSERLLDPQSSNLSHAGVISATILDEGITIKEELLENEEKIGPEDQKPAHFCSICKLSFENIRNFRYHKVVRHTQPQFECSICRKKYHFGENLRKHAKNCPNLRCLVCDINFRLRRNLDNHNIEKHGYASMDDTLNKSKTSKKKRLRYELPVRNEAGDLVWPCSKCKLHFIKRTAQQYHMVVHHTEPKYKCSFCQKMLHYRSDYNRHSSVCAEYQCAECGIRFPTRILLNQHNINKHAHDANSKNVKVPGSSTPRNGIEERQKTEESFPCSICGLSFPKRTLKRHMIYNHTEPQLKCRYCEKMFHQAYKLRCHEKLCSELRCHKCGLMFTSRVRLRIHSKNKCRRTECEAERPDQVIQDEELISKATSAQHISTINGRIQRWIAASKSEIPDLHAEVQITGSRRATVKCSLCSKTLSICGHIFKNGSIDWNIYSFKRHISSHMKSAQNVVEGS